MSRLGALTQAWLPVIAWMVLILSLSSQSELPARQNPATGEVIRSTYTLAKAAHVVQYSILALLILRAATSPAGGIGLGFAGAALWVVVAATAFGAGDELRQSLVPNREPRLADVLLDGASALAAVGAACGVRRLRAATNLPASQPVGE